MIYDHECNGAEVRGNFCDVSLSCQMPRRKPCRSTRPRTPRAFPPPAHPSQTQPTSTRNHQCNGGHDPMVACDLNPVPFDILKRIQLLRGYLNPNDLTYKYALSTE